MVVIIPARYASTRLPGKPLLDIAGRPMIAHVYARARESGAQRVVVATDDPRIAQAVESFGGEVCMTAETHPSGTDRIAEAIERLGLGAEEIVVNLQGDEPLMPPALIREVAEALAARPDAVMSTASHQIDDDADFQNPNVVKVVTDSRGNALYFSRAPIPFPRDSGGRMTAGTLPQRHIGIYGYRAGFVRRYAAWPPCALETAEALEQLRVLWHGERIVVVSARTAPPAGVDTPEDLERARRALAAA